MLQTFAFPADGLQHAFILWRTLISKSLFFMNMIYVVHLIISTQRFSLIAAVGPLFNCKLNERGIYVRLESPNKLVAKKPGW